MRTPKKIFKVLFFIFLISYLFLDVFIYFAYTKGDTEKRLNTVVEQLSKINTDTLPLLLFSAYEKIHPGSLESNTYPDPLWYIYSRNKHYPEKEVIGLMVHVGGFESISSCNQIDNRLTNRQCIFGYLDRIHYGYETKGLRAASEKLYGKSMKDLNMKEWLEIIIMSENPTLFDKLRHPENLEKKLRKYLNS